MKYLYFEISSQIGKERYFCSKYEGQRFPIDDSLAEIGFCDAYDVEIVRDATEGEARALAEFMSHGMDIVDASRLILHPEVFKDGEVGNGLDVYKLDKAMELLKCEKREGEGTQLRYIEYPDEKLHVFENYLGVVHYIEDVKKTIEQEERLRMLLHPESYKEPEVRILWSECALFKKGARYAAKDFSVQIGYADQAVYCVHELAEKHFGSWQAWYDAADEKNPVVARSQSFLGYEKVKFVLSLPSGEQIIDRYDIGDGHCSLDAFLRSGSQRYINAADEIDLFYLFPVKKEVA